MQVRQRLACLQEAFNLAVQDPDRTLQLVSTAAQLFSMSSQCSEGELPHLNGIVHQVWGGGLALAGDWDFKLLHL